jgi:hypothetical protein
VLAQRSAFVRATKESARLKLGDHKVNELMQPEWDRVEHHVKTVGRFRLQPFPHRVRDVSGRTGNLEATVAAGDLRELSDRQVFTPSKGHQIIAAAVTGVRLRGIG